MIRRLRDSEYIELERLLKRDLARNYFTLLGISSKKSPYKDIYGEFTEDGNLKAVLFLRKTGLVQFFTEGSFDLEGFSNVLRTLDYKGMIAPSSYSNRFLEEGVFSGAEPGAFISRLCADEKIFPNKHPYKIRSLVLKDLDEVVEIYQECFKSFAPRNVMEDKLISARGRGVALEEKGRILSLAQTDFESRDGALIVGVATRTDYRNKGLASYCLEELIEILQREGKDLYLQYDNLEAGKIYERLGFKVIDQVMHYIR